MKYSSRIFKSLSHPIRRQILQELKDGELSAGEIVSRFEISGPSISRHLALLGSADLISERREANRILYRVEADNLTAALNDFLSAVCPSQIKHRRKGR